MIPENYSETECYNTVDGRKGEKTSYSCKAVLTLSVHQLHKASMTIWLPKCLEFSEV
jgi:hypothetical protein